SVDAFGIVGMSSATASPDVENFVNGQNPAGNGTLLISATSGFSNCSFSPLASNGSRANGTITLARVLPTQGTHGDLALTRLLRGARAVADATEGAVADARRNVRANYTSIFARAVVLQQTLSTAIQSVGRSAAGALVTPLQAFTASVDVDLGTLAGGRSITVIYDVTVDPPPVATYDTHATISGSNFSTFDTTTGTMPGDRYNTTTVVASSKTPAARGESVPLTATVTPTQGTGLTPDGTIQFKDNGVAIGSPIVCADAGSNTCAAQVATSSLLPPSRNITAEYSGGTNHDPSTSATLVQTIIACTANPTVINTNDSGAGSLRQAIADACQSPGSNTITLDGALSGSIDLTSGELLLPGRVISTAA